MTYCVKTSWKTLVPMVPGACLNIKDLLPKMWQMWQGQTPETLVRVHLTKHNVFFSDPHCRTKQSDSGNTEPDSDTNRVDESDTYDEPTDGTNKQDDYQGWSSNPINKEWVPRSRYKRKQNKIKKTRTYSSI